MFLVRVNDDAYVTGFHVGTRADYDRLKPTQPDLRFIDRSDLWYLDDMGAFIRNYTTFFFVENGTVLSSNPDI